MMLVLAASSTHAADRHARLRRLWRQVVIQAVAARDQVSTCRIPLPRHTLAAAAAAGWLCC